MNSCLSGSYKWHEQGGVICVVGSIAGIDGLKQGVQQNVSGE